MLCWVHNEPPLNTRLFLIFCQFLAYLMIFQSSLRKGDRKEWFQNIEKNIRFKKNSNLTSHIYIFLVSIFFSVKMHRATSFYMYTVQPKKTRQMRSGPEKLKNSRQKKLVKSNKSISRMFLDHNPFFAISKMAKNQFVKKFKTAKKATSRTKWAIFDFTSFFCLEFFKFSGPLYIRYPTKNWKVSNLAIVSKNI